MINAGPVGSLAVGPVRHGFERQVECTPAAAAVEFGEERITYAELNERANRLAHLLRAHGVGPETRVALCLERGLELPAALLAVLKAGGAYVPLDPAYPAERLAYMLADSGAALLVTVRALAPALDAHGVPLLLLDEAADALAAQPDGDPAPLAAPENLAYVIYTSGSTGRPKGVMVPRSALASHMAWMQRAFPLDPRDRVLQKTPYSFDASVWEFHAPLMAGATLVMAAPGAHRDPAVLVRTLMEREITVVQMVPSLLRAVLDAGGLEGAASLRRLFCGGEALGAELAARARRATEAEIVNLYGPTEVCIDATSRAYAGETAGTVPLGRPVDGVRAYVVEGWMDRVPGGGAGELLLGGAQVARGYLARPALTAERFVPDPFGGEPGARLYRTGDRARWTAAGELDFLGRADGQVKVRGFRIEPGEVEAVLRAFPGVRDAAVAARADAAGGERLVGYVAANGSSPRTSELRAFAAARLPEHMVPGAFVVLPGLPLTPSGKVDRRALPEPEGRPELAAEFAAPRTPVEEALCGIWAQVLGVERVGVDDDFFDLGGHSLGAMQILARVRDALDVDIPLGTLFDAKTVAGLAREVEGGRRTSIRIPVLPPDQRSGLLPVVYSQEQVWFLQKLNPESLAYGYQTLLEIDGALDAELLHQSLTAIVERHEMYRTTFPEVEGRPVQRIHPPHPAFFTVVDLSGEADPDAAAEARVREEIRIPFVLDRLPLVRWVLLRLGDDRHRLLHVEQHLIHDGWSFNRFLQELLETYRALAAGERPALPEMPVQFADYAAWQREWMEGPRGEEHLAFWRRTLAGAPESLPLPLDRPRPPVQGFRGAAERVELPAALCRRLREVGRGEGATLYMTMLAAFYVLLQRWSGEDDLSIGSGVANRSLRDVDPLLGMLVNVIVLRARLDGDPPFRALLRRVRAASLDALAHQEYPLEKIVEALRPQRGLDRNPLFQVGFSFHDSALPGVEVPGLKVRVREGLNNGSAKFDIDVVGIPRAGHAAEYSYGWEPDGLTLIWTYSTELFEGETIRRMLTHYRTLLEAVVEDADRPISALPLMDAAERARLLAAGSEAAPPLDPAPVHHRFERQAADTPDAPAVEAADGRLTYAELNARANRLAHLLRARGVGAETRVALCLERGIDLATAVLAVLKAGGAYLPLDPAYPPERLAHMREDSGATLLLAHSKLLSSLRTDPAQTICLDRIDAALAEQPEIDPVPLAGPGNLAYVIYTSGSTGRPKGVMVPHGALSNHMGWMQRAHPLSASDRVLQKTPYSFDASVWEFFAPLLAGGTLVMAAPGVHREPALLARAIAEAGITVVQMVPSLLRAVLEAGGLEHATALRRLFCGGEALPAELAERARRAAGAEVVNLYGPTEVCIDATARIHYGVEGRETVPLGRPVDGVRAYVVDGRMEPCPVGVPGELLLGGAQVARGYLGRPGMTAERFVPDPFSGEAGARLYRSGDRVRWTAAGELDFLGRVDEQVKVRGFRIEPGEVEAVLRQAPGVRDAAVAARGEALVGYVAADGAALTAGELRAFAAERLPEHMVPSVFVVLDALPLTPSGKVDRRALPEPEGRAEAAAEYVPPRDAVEELLCDIWSQVLGVERVGVHDDFFDLGGHSLLVTRVLARVRDALRVELPVRAVFERPTVAQLAARIGTSAAARRPAAPRGTLAAATQRMAEQQVDALLDMLLHGGPGR